MDKLETKIRDFSSYLMDIGFLNAYNYMDFCKKFKEMSRNSIASSGSDEVDNNLDLIYFKDNASKTIVEFYNSMNDDKKKLFAINIFAKYTKQKEEEENNKNNFKNKTNINKNYENVIENIESFNILGIKKEENKNNKKEKSKSKEEDENNQDGACSLGNFMNNKKNKINKINSPNKRNNNFALKNNKNLEEESKQNKQQLNENCTFQPNINSTKNKNNKSKNDKKNISTVFERLCKTNEPKKNEIKSLEKERDKENIFQPNLEKNKKIQKKLSRKNFEERLKKFEDAKKNKEEKRKKDEEKEFKEKFPFKPKRHNSFNKSFRKDKNNIYASNDNLYQRLYDENKKMKNKYEENLKQLMNDIRDRANHPIVKHNNISYIRKMKKNYYVEKNENIIKNTSFDNPSKRSIPLPYYQTEDKKDNEKMYEFKRIEELYEEYKRIKNQINLNENIQHFQDNDNNNNDDKKEIINEKNENKKLNLNNNKNIIKDDIKDINNIENINNANINDYYIDNSKDEENKKNDNNCSNEIVNYKNDNLNLNQDKKNIIESSDREKK